MLKLCPLVLAFFLILSFTLHGQEEDSSPAEISANLDPLVTLPSAYSLTPDDLEELFPKGKWNRNPYFKWLRKDRSRAIFQKKNTENLKVDLLLFGETVPIEEAVVDFKEGKYLGVTISIFNRGDGGSIGTDDFNARLRSAGQHLGKQLDCRPVRKESKPSQGLLTQGFIWTSARGKAVLEHNEEAPGNTEFLRMRLSRRDAGGSYEAATQTRAGATVTLSELPRNVKRDDEGNVFIPEIPMVDQGAKGYCVVASVQRLFEYYGIACDMHQLAEIAGSDPDSGTNIIKTNSELGAIDHLFKTRFECLAVRQGPRLVELVDDKYVGDTVPSTEFFEMIEDSIEDGIPLLWALEVGRYEEDPPLEIQTSGGHMRMITGYNNETNQIIFSDSWGAGHEFKTMAAEDALMATHGLFQMKPVIR